MLTSCRLNKAISAIFLLLFTIHIFAQKSAGIQLNSGLNRVGVFYAFALYGNLQNHHLSLGARFYEPDIFFEKNTLGLSLNYGYRLHLKQKFKLLIGANMNCFREKKTEALVYLLDTKLLCSPEWYMGQHSTLFFNLGAGPVVSFTESKNIQNKNPFIYANYEIAIGIRYAIFGQRDIKSEL
jgi:hypothetical protein